MELIVLWTAVGVFAAVAVLALAKLLRADGYGMRPAPRGFEDWSADGLPSHPYGG